MTTISKKGCRAKGASGEKELFSLLSNELGFVVKRELAQAVTAGATASMCQGGRSKLSALRRTAQLLGSGRQAGRVCWPAPGVVLAQEPGEVGCICRRLRHRTKHLQPWKGPCADDAAYVVPACTRTDANWGRIVARIRTIKPEEWRATK
jgi:hypothetical protein